MCCVFVENSTSRNDELDLIFLNKKRIKVKILEAGKIWLFDPGVKVVSKTILCVHMDLSLIKPLLCHNQIC